jgi:hypothetical protein
MTDVLKNGLAGFSPLLLWNTPDVDIIQWRSEVLPNLVLKMLLMNSCHNACRRHVHKRGYILPFIVARMTIERLFLLPPRLINP